MEGWQLLLPAFSFFLGNHKSLALKSRIDVKKMIEITDRT